MKRILIFSLTYIPFVGGAEVAVKEITDRIADGYEWDLITVRPSRNHPKFEKIGNVNVYRIGFANNQVDNLSKIGFIFRLNKILYPILAFMKAIRLNRERKYEGIWSIMAAYAGLAGLFFKTFNRKVKSILTLQEGDTSEHVKRKAGLFSFLLKKIFKQADYIQAISKYLISFAKDFDCDKDIVVIPNGVDLSKFTGDILIKDNKTNFKIITTSRLVEKNGLRDLILSLRYLDDTYTLDILGTGPLSSELLNLVRENKLGERVNFVGTLSQSDMISYLRQSDVFVRPSLSEGLGNSFLEAMAIGLPIIGTAVGGIVDFLVDSETGLFCKVHNPEDIAEKIKIIKNDDNLRKKLIENGQKLVKEKYSWELIVRQFQSEIFDKIV